MLRGLHGNVPDGVLSICFEKSVSGLCAGVNVWSSGFDEGEWNDVTAREIPTLRDKTHGICAPVCILLDASIRQICSLYVT